MGTLVEMPPRGHYLAHEVGRLAGISGNTVGQWARRCYIRSSQSDGRPRVYSYGDVAEAMVVHELVDKGVPHRVIKRSLPQLRREYGQWPLSRARLLVPIDGSRPALILEAGELIDLDRKRGQGILIVSNLEEIASDLDRGGWAARSIPDLRLIEVNPNRLSGRPVIRGRRVPAEDVARLAETEEGRMTLREGYGLTDEEIIDAVRWWEAVQRYEAVGLQSVTAGHLLVVDATFGDHLAQQLVNRGRRAASVRVHPFGEALDDVLLPGLAGKYRGSDWILITSDDGMPAEHHGLIASLGLTIATLDGDIPSGMKQEHYKCEVVHRWVHKMQLQPPAEVRRYTLSGSNLWAPKRRKRRK